MHFINLLVLLPAALAAPIPGPGAVLEARKGSSGSTGSCGFNIPAQACSYLPPDVASSLASLSSAVQGFTGAAGNGGKFDLGSLIGGFTGKGRRDNMRRSQSVDDLISSLLKGSGVTFPKTGLSIPTGSTGGTTTSSGSSSGSVTCSSTSVNGQGTVTDSHQDGGASCSSTSTTS